MNVAVLRGTLPRPSEERRLATGSTLVQFDLTTVTPGGVVTVPVSWADPPPGATPAVGAEVVVVGHVRRRFFRAGAGTQSRTEVVAETVTAASDRRKVSRVLAAASGRLAGGRAPGDHRPE